MTESRKIIDMAEPGTVYDVKLFSVYSSNLLGRVHDLLEKSKQHGIKIVTAESLTGGGIAAFLSALSGSSNMLDRAYVVYNNEAKIDLGVSASDLKIHEAVSVTVAKQMAFHALRKSNAQISVAVTGYASKEGDNSRGIKGGTVFIAAARKNSSQIIQGKATKHIFSTDRTKCRHETLRQAMAVLEKQMDLAIKEKSKEKPAASVSGALKTTKTARRVEK